jgi:hypothetical protein
MEELRNEKSEWMMMKGIKSLPLVCPFKHTKLVWHIYQNLQLKTVSDPFFLCHTFVYACFINPFIYIGIMPFLVVKILYLVT